jgi:methionyl-tRNA formyltransferase
VTKVLIVSDNIELVSYIKIVSQEISKDIAEINYCYSSINKAPKYLEAMGMSAIDMKDQSNVNMIISTYKLVISAHCKQIFPKDLVKLVRCINIHPGLNPYNRGWFPQVFSIINKKPIGCTIHLMDEEIDHGAVIYQSAVYVNVWDTSLDVYKKVVSAEKIIIKNHLLDLIQENYTARTIKNEGNYNGIDDFKKLAQLDLTSTGTLAEHIDLLRALTHGEFKNAYFIDEEGKKVYLQLRLTVDEIEH